MINSLIKIEKPMYYASIIPLIIMLIALILQNIFRGATIIDSVAGVAPCSVWYWIIILIYTLFGFGLFAMNLYLAKNHSSQHKEYGYGVNYSFDLSKILSIVFFSCLSGALSSFVGIGVWIIMTPLMLNFGFPEYVSIYTSVAIELASRLANSAQFIFNINQFYGYIGLFAGLAILGAFPGILYLQDIFRIGKRSVFIFILYALLLCIALVSNIITDAISIKHDFDNNIGGLLLWKYTPFPPGKGGIFFEKNDQHFLQNYTPIPPY